MLLEYHEHMKCVSVVDLILVRNLYAGSSDPDPTVPVSFTYHQRQAASKAFYVHRRRQAGDEWKTFQSAVLNGQHRTSIITRVDQARLVAEKVVNTGQTTGCCSSHGVVSFCASSHLSSVPHRDLRQILERLGVQTGSLVDGR